MIRHILPCNGLKELPLTLPLPNLWDNMTERQVALLLSIGLLAPTWLAYFSSGELIFGC